MTVKPNGKAVRTCASSVVALLLATAALIYPDVAKGSVKWKYAIPILTLLFIYDVLTVIIYLRVFNFSADGIEVKLLFFRKLYRWQDLAVKSDNDVINAPSRRGKGFLYGSTAAATSGMEAGNTGGTPSNYLSPYINVDTGKDRYVTRVAFCKKGGGEKTSDMYQFIHPFSLIRILLLPGDAHKAGILYHTANKDEFTETVAGYGVSLPEE